MVYKVCQAAFQGTNGHTYACGPFHDVDQVPPGVTIAHEGFLTDGGDFVTREQATKDLAVDHPLQSEELGLAKEELDEEEAETHEFSRFFRAWLAERAAREEVAKAEDLSELLGRHNLADKFSYRFHEVAYHQSGFDADTSPPFLAAKFLAGGKTLPPEVIRRALIAYDQDLEVAALYAYGIPRNEDNLAALRSVVDAQALNKSEIVVSAIPRLVTAFDAVAEPVAQAVRRAFGSNGVHAVNFKGKHAKGMAIAVDPEDEHKYLLKPGSGPLSPSLGVREVLASQSRREVAFSKIMADCGLGEYVAAADLLYLDGEEVAAMDLVDTDHRGADWRKNHDKSFVASHTFEPYRQNGILFRWAVMDMVLANPDRHAGNILISDDNDIKLIDHGSAFAGPSFDPANDSKSFVPFYLRAWYGDNFTKLSLEQRLTHLPSCPREAETSWNTWVDELNPAVFEEVMAAYGIVDPSVIERLQNLKAIPAEHRLDALLGFWAGEE